MQFFINRISECKALAKHATDTASRSSFILLSAPTGIGKSELVDQVFGNSSEILYARVKIPKHEKIQDNPGYYIKEFGKAINRIAQKTDAVLSFKEFCRLKKSKKGVLEFAQNIAADYVKKKTDSQEIADWIRDLGKKSDNDFTNTVFSSDHSAAFHSIVEYVSCMTQDNKMIVALENIQSVDLDSLGIFKRLLSESNRLVLVGEYTQNSFFSQDEHSLYDFFNDENINCQIIQLRKLDLRDILEACVDKPDRIIAILQEGYEKSTGNLHPLRLMLSQETQEEANNCQTIIKYDDIIVNRIKGLAPDETMLLVSIVAHGGLVDIELLRKSHFYDAIINVIPNTIISLESRLDDLDHKLLIQISDEQVKICQDSIIDIIISDDSFAKYLLIAYKTWLTFYQNIRKGAEDFFISHSEALSWEVYFKAVLSDISGVGELLNELYSLTLLSAAPKRALNYLKKLRKKLLNRIDSKKFLLAIQQIDQGIVRVLYRLGCFEEILPLTEQQTDPLLQLFHASSLAVTGQSEKAIIFCNTMSAPKNRILWESQQLIILAALRASNRYTECKDMWKRLYREKVFAGSQLEGMFLRASDLALIDELEERIKYLTNAADIFEINSDNLQAFWTRNAMVQHLSYEGLLDEAQEQMSKASASGAKIFSSHYVIENNNAVLALQRGIAGIAEIKRLKKAAYLCDTILDRFIIWNNLLVAQSMIQDNSGVAAVLALLEHAMQTETVEDFDLKRIALFNAAIHYQEIGLDDVASQYIAKAKDLPLICDIPYWTAKLNGIQKSPDEDFRYSLKYYPVHISSWHFDFDIVLGNSQ